MTRRRLLATLTALVATAALLTTGGVAQAGSDQLLVYRVPVPTAAAAHRLAAGGFDVLENRSGDDLFVLGDASTADRLRAAGFRPTVDQRLRPAEWTAAPKATAAPIDETYYGGYHTVNAQYAHLDKVAADRPDLASVVDFGDSYLKTRNAATGYDLKAICLTHRQAGDCALTPSAPKPRFLLMAQIHAREIVTGDIAWRFIDHLVAGYGSNSQVTALLDSTEVWVVPISNPDGVDLVQKGGNQPYLQRKNLNANGANCANPPNAFSQAGVDLNRNNGDHWNTSGTSPLLCSQTYPGKSAGSEPETKGLEGLFKSLWPDQRGPADGDAAPATTRGSMITLHSYAGMNLYPWGWSTRNTGNEAKLKAIAQQMTTFNGYQNGQPGDILYNAAGGNDDWAYGQLGVASFTIEVASCNSFTPRYSCTTTDFDKNLGALLYVAGKAKAPYA
jgi:carboxypeptidase T